MEPLDEVQAEQSDKGRESVTIDEVVCLILSEYPFTNLNHFTASFREGGLTEPQVETLFFEAVKRTNRQNAIIASFHGYEISDSENSSGRSAVKKEHLPPGVSNPKTFVFGDPKEYEGMSEGQKAQLTQEMMGNHHNWVSNKQKSAVR